MNRTSCQLTSTLCTVFWMSGAAALLFESLWFRLAALAFGNSVWAAALVIGGFMAGLAVGNGWAARYGRRIRNPFRFYAVLEVLIGITGLTLVLLLPRMEVWLTPFFRHFHNEMWFIHPVRLALTFGVFLVPTAAMGATLPLLVRGLSAFDANFGRVLGRLYGWNTMGAVAGALVGEIALIRWLGIAGTGVVACSLNLLAGGIVFIVERNPIAARRRRAHSSHLNEERREDGVARAVHEAPHRAPSLLIAAALSGFLLLALEVVWFRLLQFVYHGTSLSFALMLAVVLAGIALGGLAASRYASSEGDRIWDLHRLAMGCGMAAILSYAGFDVFYRGLAQTGLTLGGSFVVAGGVLMLPSSFMSGIFFTRVGVALKRELGEATRTAGLLTLSNTCGAALGPLVAGFLLLPLLGMDGSSLVIGLGYGLVAIILSPRMGLPATGKGRWDRGFVGIYCLLLSFLVLGRIEERQFGLVDAALPDAKRVATRVGPVETAAYYRHDRFGEPFFYRLVSNGFSMSSTDPRSQRYMKLFVHLPVAIHPGMERALLVGYGVGSTAKALTNTKELKQIDIVDISREILELAEVVYPDEAEHPLRDPRVNVRIDDGRFYLRSTGHRYDLITSEPPPPKNAGVVNLYSQEFFQLAYDRLAEGGIMTHWLPVYQMDEAEAGSIIRAFANVFADVTLWEGGGLNWILMGTRDCAGPGSTERLVRQWSDAVVGLELRHIGMEEPGQLGAIFIADADFLAAWTADSLPLTDNFPQRLSTDFLKGRDRARLFADLADGGARARFRTSPTVLRWWPDVMHKETLRFFDYQRWMERVLGGDYRPPANRPLPDLYRVLTRTELTTLPQFMLGSSPLETLIAKGLKDAGRGIDGEVRYALACQAMADRRYNAAVDHLAMAFESTEAGGNEKILAVYLFALCMADRFTEAAELVESLEPAPTKIRAHWDWMEAFFGR